MNAILKSLSCYFGYFKNTIFGVLPNYIFIFKSVTNLFVGFIKILVVNKYKACVFFFFFGRRLVYLPNKK